MLLNLLGFNLSWFGLILLGNIFIPLSLLWLGLHLYLCKDLKNELKLILTIVVIGTLVDTTLLSLDILIFPEHHSIPLWLITLWACFAATVAHSLQFLAQSSLLQVIIGFFIPPLSYLGGASLSAVELGYSHVTTYFILASIWSVLMVLFFHFKEIHYGQVKYG
ncbi:MAG: DUF2878 domain-containing protein [Colwelliaceae bacterium]|jgi:hypothetical protein|nr:DUF2878 domain-containing protein [Colwelliaceae bacterium]